MSGERMRVAFETRNKRRRFRILPDVGEVAHEAGGAPKGSSSANVSQAEANGGLGAISSRDPRFRSKDRARCAALLGEPKQAPAATRALARRGRLRGRCP